MYDDSIDPESLITIIEFGFEDGGWEFHLRKLVELIQNFVNEKEHQLPEDAIDNVFYVGVPKIVNKCLQMTQISKDGEGVIVQFLAVVIHLALYTISIYQKSLLIHVVNHIIDPSCPFYIYFGREQNLQYSGYLIYLVQYILKINYHYDLCKFLKGENNYSFDDFEISVQFFARLISLREMKEVFPDIQYLENAICVPLQKYAVDTEDRKIPYKKIFNIITSICPYLRDENFYSLVCEIIIHFIEIDIIDIKIVAVKLLDHLYLKAIPRDVLLSNNEFFETFAFIVTASNLNLEMLTLLKPLLILYASNDFLNDVIISQIYERINDFAPSVRQKGLDIFCDVCLRIKSKVESVLKLMSNPPDVDLLSRLIAGPLFQEQAKSLLITLAENDGKRIAFEALIKASMSIDLSMLLPQIMNNIGKKEYLIDHINLISSIINKTPVSMKTDAILYNFAHNLPMFNKCIDHILQSLSTILRKTNTKISKENIELIFQNCKDHIMLTKIIKTFYNENDLLVQPQANDVVLLLFNRIITDFSMFEIIEHLYSVSKTLIWLKDLNSSLFDSLWNSLMHPSTKNQRTAISKLLLTYTNEEISEVPSKLCQYSEKCLNILISDHNPNAALFIDDIFKFTYNYTVPEQLEIIPHYFTIPENYISVTIDTPDKTQLIIEISNSAKLSNLIALLSYKIKRDVTSIILYSNGKSIPNDTRVIDTNKKFEARFKNFHEKYPKFTLEQHPISVIYNLINEMVLEKIKNLLASPIGNLVYNIMIQIPTPKQFKPDLKIDPSKPYLFLYNLHYIAKHINDFPHKAEVQENIEQILCDKIDIILPESQYLMVTLLNKNTKNEKLVTSVFYKLCIQKNNDYFDLIAKQLFEIIYKFDTDIPKDILSAMIFSNHNELNRIIITSHLIQTQKFEKIWGIFVKFNNEDKLKFVNILTQFEIPSNLYQEIFDTLFPLFDSLNESILEIFAKLSEKWSEFPASKITDILINSYIKCITKPVSISSNPFKLILAIINNNETMRKEIIDCIQNTIPEEDIWNYAPVDSFQVNGRCGLNNLSATCYINSVLQQLFNIEPLRNYIISMKEIEDSSMKALHILFTQMLYSKRKYIDMKNFAESWTGWDLKPINVKDQQDANEFLMLVLSRIESIDQSIYNLVSGNMETRLSSKSNNFSTSSISTFTILPLVVLNQKCIKDSMLISNLPEEIQDYKIDNSSTSITVESINKIVSLPSYLFFQLKRFDYSIEKQTRIKIEQQYEFEYEIDLKKYVEYDGETRFNLIGVIVHQGDVDAGHYISYIKLNSNNSNSSSLSWICLNDVGVSLVSDASFKNDAYGCENGSTGYILVYKRFDADNIPDVPLEPEDDLIREIEKDNLKLIVDSVYITDYFSQFINTLLTTNSNNTEIVNVAIMYYMKCLVHSSLIDSFNLLTDTFVRLIDENENFLSVFLNFIQDNDNIIMDVLLECTNKTIKIKFTEILCQIFKKTPTDNPLMLIIITQSDEWMPVLLSNWRNGFDFFKIFYDFANIDSDHLDFLNEYNLGQETFNFVVQNFQPFVNNKNNKTSQERFRRLCDMTYILKVLKITNYPIDQILAPNFLKWCIGSEKHSDALIEIIGDNIKRFDKLIENCNTPLNERLLLNIASQFQDDQPKFYLTQETLHRHFSKSADQKHLLAALIEKISSDLNQFEMLAKQQKSIIAYLLFSKSREVRNDILIEIKQLVSKNSDSKEIYNRIASIIFPFISYVLSCSRNLYSLNPHYANTIVPQDKFACLNFLDYLIELYPKLNNALSYLDYVGNVLGQITASQAINHKRDEHYIRIALLGCLMLCDSNIPVKEITTLFIFSIQTIISKMMLPNHSELDFALRKLCEGLIRNYESPNMKAELLIPDSLSNIIVDAALSKDTRKSRLTKEATLTLLNTCSRRYASQKVALKAIIQQGDSVYDIDIKLVYLFLSTVDKDLFKSNLQLLIENKFILSKITTSFISIKDNENALMKMNELLPFIIESEASHTIIKNSLTQNKNDITNFLMFLCDDKAQLKFRLIGLSIIRQLIHITHGSFITIKDIILTHFIGEANDLDLFGACLIKESDSENINKRIIQELNAAILNVQESNERPNIFQELIHITISDEVFSAVKETHFLEKLWQIKPSPGITFQGVYDLTIASQAHLNQESKKEILNAASKYKTESDLHEKIIELFSQE